MFSLIDITPQPVLDDVSYPKGVFRLFLEDGNVDVDSLKPLDSIHNTLFVRAVLDEDGNPLPGFSHYCAPTTSGHALWVHVLRTEDAEAAQQAAMTSTDPAYPNHLDVATVLVELKTGKVIAARREALLNCSLLLNIQPRGSRHA